jgi:glutathione S-transferase
MYTLYIGNKNYSSWSLRPWVLMRTLGIPFEERLLRFEGPAGHAKFRAVSPTGMVPCLHDGATVVWDTLAITEYLAERHPGVWPKDPAARAWARCAAAEMHGGFATMRNICTHNIGVRVRLRDRAPLAPDLARLTELWSEGLTRFGGPFLAGADFTAVDAFYAPVANRLQTYGLTLGPTADAYATRLRDLPAMRDWTKAALAENFRETGHEAELLAAGTLLEDLRVPETQNG